MGPPEMSPQMPKAEDRLRVIDSELRRSWQVCVFLVLALWALFAYPWLIGRVTIPYDAKALFQAQLQFLASAIHSGQSPAWNPHSFVGVPQIADPQSFIFSPGLLLAALSKSPDFWLLDVYVFVLLGIAAGAVLMLFRDRGWHPGGAAVAALCFAFGGSASWRMQHIGQIQSYAFFALTLWLLLRARERGSMAWGASAGVAAGLMLAEPDQVALLACYLLAIVVAADWLSSPSLARAVRRDVAPLSAAAITTVLIAALPLALTYVFLAGSNRPSIEFAEAARGSLHPASILTLLVPDLFGIKDAALGYWGPYSEAWDRTELTLSPNMSQLYMGALPCLVLLSGVLSRGALRRSEIAGYSAAALIALVYALGDRTPMFRLIYELIPGVALFRRPADATFLLGGFLSILVGYLVHLHFTGGLSFDRSAIRRHIMTLFILVCLGSGLAAAHGRLGSVLVPLTVAVVWIAAAALVLTIPSSTFASVGRLAAFLPALVVGADLTINNGPSEATGKPVDRALEALKPETRNETIAFLSQHLRRRAGTQWRDRIEVAGIGFDWQNAAEAHGFDQTLGYNPLRTAVVTRALGAGDYIAGYEQRAFSPLFPSYRCRLADLLGLRFIASPVPISRLDRRIGDEDLNFVGRTTDAYIYENPRALPRVLFVEKTLAADFERILADGRWPEFDPRQTVLLDRSEAASLGLSAQTTRPGPAVAEFQAASFPNHAAASTGGPDSEKETEAEAVIVRYENTRIEVAVTAPRAGFLVLGDVWHPWWLATVNGAGTVIRRANVMFRAVAVPAGRHRVRFEFHPISGALDELSKKLMSGR